MKHSKVFIHAAIWLATSAAVITGLLFTDDAICLFAFGFPAFISLLLEK